jgi:hypothetical protein
MCGSKYILSNLLLIILPYVSASKNVKKYIQATELWAGTYCQGGISLVVGKPIGRGEDGCVPVGTPFASVASPSGITVYIDGHCKIRGSPVVVPGDPSCINYIGGAWSFSYDSGMMDGKIE